MAPHVDNLLGKPDNALSWKHREEWWKPHRDVETVNRHGEQTKTVKSVMHFLPTKFRRLVGRSILRAGIVASLMLLASPDDVWAVSLRLKLEMLGYSEAEIGAIISGKERREDLDRRIKMAMLCLHVPSPPVGSTSLNKPEKVTPKIDPVTKGLHYHNQTSSGLLGRSARGEVPLRENEKQYLPIVRSAAQKNQLDESLIMAVIKVESNFNPEAVSPKGAMGLMQLVPSTASSLGVVDPYNPQENIYGGAEYLSQCIDLFQDMELALAAYNAGPHLVDRIKKVPPYPETQNFIKDVFFYKKVYDKLL
jgi:hypothetical protein